MALRAFDLLEGLDVVMFGAIHYGEDLGDKAGFIAGPAAARAGIERF